MRACRKRILENEKRNNNKNIKSYTKPFDSPERVARRVSVPHHQVGRAVPGLGARHVKLEYGHPYLVPGTVTVTGIVINRISGGRVTGRGGLQMIPARRVLRQRVVRRVQPTTASVSYPEFTTLVLRVLDRFDLHKMHLTIIKPDETLIANIIIMQFFSVHFL